jgi:hypothetical protein
MSEESQHENEAHRRLLETIGTMLEEARRMHPEAYAAASNDPVGVGFYLFSVWFAVCGKPPYDVKAELSRYIEIFSTWRKLLDEGQGGALGRSPSEVTQAARLMKQAGMKTDEICRAVVPDYAELTPVRQKEERQKLRDRMRQQERYARKGKAGAKGRGRGRAPGAQPPR